MWIAPSASLHLLHAYHVPFKGLLAGEEFAGGVAYRERLELEAFLKDEMEALEQRARQLGIADVALKRSIREGEPTQALRAVCESEGADLVVIATHGRGGLSRAIWGSVAVDLLDDPPCDVLVIKPY